MQRVKALREKNQSFKLQIRKKEKQTQRNMFTLWGGGEGKGREEDLPLPSPHCKEACSLKMAVFFRQALPFQKYLCINSYTLTPVCIFSLLFFINFLRCSQGEFV